MVLMDHLMNSRTDHFVTLFQVQRLLPNESNVSNATAAQRRDKKSKTKMTKTMTLLKDWTQENLFILIQRETRFMT